MDPVGGAYPLYPVGVPNQAQPPGIAYQLQGDGTTVPQRSVSHVPHVPGVNNANSYFIPQPPAAFAQHAPSYGLYSVPVQPGFNSMTSSQPAVASTYVPAVPVPQPPQVRFAENEHPSRWQNPFASERTYDTAPRNASAPLPAAGLSSQRRPASYIHSVNDYESRSRRFIPVNNGSHRNSTFRTTIPRGGVSSRHTRYEEASYDSWASSESVSSPGLPYSRSRPPVPGADRTRRHSNLGQPNVWTPPKQISANVSFKRVSRYLYVDGYDGSLQAYDREGDDTGFSDHYPDHRRQESQSITLLRHFDENRTLLYHSLKISSSSFFGLLRELGKYPVHATQSESGSSRQFSEPFVDIFYRRNSLREYVQNVDTSSLSQNRAMRDKVDCSKIVLGLLDNDFSTLNRGFDLFQSSNPPEMVAFGQLWMIYSPGSLVFASIEGQPPFALMVESVEYNCSTQESESNDVGLQQPLTLHCWHLDYRKTDGKYDGKFGRVPFTARVEAYQGVRPIAGLQFIPERFEKTLSRRAMLLERGREFWNLSGPTFREVQRFDRQGRPTMDRDRVMVDPTSDNSETIAPEPTKASADPELRSRTDLSNIDPASPYRDGRVRQWAKTQAVNNVDLSGDASSNYKSINPSSEPTELMLVLCPPTVRAFSLHERTWSEYSVGDLRPVKFQENAWSRLVIDQKYKDVVQSMVNSHLRQSNSFQDIVPGKGGGVVILLHGPPGVGKTLTAESVAENVNKPLYMVTAGDLGTDPTHLESRLVTIFKLAAKWDAILLLDEADVFLQDRDYENLTRNALVSIFLRTLEYFKGIMFLTSNRVGAFDQAFQSRIHITLGIPEFDEDVRKEVWKIFITDLGRTRRDGSEPLLTIEECKALGREVLASWAREPLNGRQIRNCVRSALALAQEKRERVSAKHFSTVIELGNTFAKYMTRLQKLDLDEIAQVKGDRLAEMRSLVKTECEQKQDPQG